MKTLEDSSREIKDPYILEQSKKIALRIRKRKGAQSPTDQLYNDAQEYEQKRQQLVEKDNNEFKQTFKFRPNITQGMKYNPFQDSGKPVQNSVQAGDRLYNYYKKYNQNLIQKVIDKKQQDYLEFDQLPFSPTFQTQNYSSRQTKAKKLDQVRGAEKKVSQIMSARF